MANATKADIENGEYYLPTPIAIPRTQNDDLDQAFWEGLTEGKIVVQFCNSCQKYQWGPEWICHRCLSWDLGWREVEGKGRIYSWERPWHPVHPGLREHVPYVVVLVELPDADGIRLVGNLLGDATDDVEIGAEVEAVFEHHKDTDPPYTLLQWARV